MTKCKYLILVILAMTLTGYANAQTNAACLARSLGSNATANGNTVTLTGDAAVERSLTVPRGITLELTADGARLFLRNGATMTVNGTINARGHSDQGRGWVDGSLCIENGAAVVINGNGTINLKSKGNLLNIYGGDGGKRLTLDGVTLVGLADNNNSLVDVNNGSELILKSGKITGNTYNGDDWGNGGGVNVYKATFIMEGGEISGNSAIGGKYGQGGGVLVSESTFIMAGGLITDNSAIGIENNGDGGGIDAEESTFTVQGGTILANFGGSNGGVWVQSGGEFIMEGGTIYGNANSLPAGTDVSLANSAGLAIYRATAKWGTGGTYTKGGVSQTSGGDIIVQLDSSGAGGTYDTLIAIPARRR